MTGALQQARHQNTPSGSCLSRWQVSRLADVEVWPRWSSCLPGNIPVATKALSGHGRGGGCGSRALILPRLAFPFHLSENRHQRAQVRQQGRVCQARECPSEAIRLSATGFDRKAASRQGRARRRTLMRRTKQTPACPYDSIPDRGDGVPVTRPVAHRLVLGDPL